MVAHCSLQGKSLNVFRASLGPKSEASISSQTTWQFPEIDEGRVGMGDPHRSTTITQLQMLMRSHFPCVEKTQSTHYPARVTSGHSNVGHRAECLYYQFTDSGAAGHETCCMVTGMPFFGCHRVHGEIYGNLQSLRDPMVKMKFLTRLSDIFDSLIFGYLRVLGEIYGNFRNLRDPMVETRCAAGSTTNLCMLCSSLERGWQAAISLPIKLLDIFDSLIFGYQRVRGEIFGNRRCLRDPMVISRFLTRPLDIFDSFIFGYVRIRGEIYGHQRDLRDQDASFGYIIAVMVWLTLCVASWCSKLVLKMQVWAREYCTFVFAFKILASAIHVLSQGPT